jgi:hypothetical protein
MAVWGPGTGSEAKNAISFSAAFSISQACHPAGLIFLTLGIAAIGIANLFGGSKKNSEENSEEISVAMPTPYDPLKDAVERR